MYSKTGIAESNYHLIFTPRRTEWQKQSLNRSHVTTKLINQQYVFSAYHTEYR